MNNYRIFHALALLLFATADNVLSLDTKSTSSMGEFKTALVYDKK